MNANEQTIARFYEAFARLDPDAMQSCYADDVAFDDEVFSLRGKAHTVVEDDATGFVFDAATPEALARATARACRRFAEPDRWRRMQRAGMAKDFSWRASAGRYAALFAALGA